MPKTLGLDLGTNSIGWALVEDGKAIIASGVRIFPVGVSEEDFLKNGKEVSKNIARRMARGARRRRFRFKLRRQQLLQLLIANGMMPSDAQLFTTRELYEMRVRGLDERLELREFGRILLMLNKRRGFKSNRKAAADPEKKKEEGGVKEGILMLQTQIDDAGLRTVGEFFFSLLQKADKEENWPNEDTPIERIRGRFVGREMYQREFNLLWEKQATYHPDVLTTALKEKIGDETIYYQRNLKSQKGLVGSCRFEKGKRCAPRSSSEFQEYRIWQQLSAIRFVNGDRIGQELTVEEKQRACVALMRQGKMTEAALKKLLGLPKNDHFNDVFGAKGLLGNRTNADLFEALGEECFDELTVLQQFELWHILTYTDNTEKLCAIVRKKIASGILPQLTEEQTSAYADLNLEEGYGNLSRKALNKILPHLRQGMPLYDAIKVAGYDPIRNIREGEGEELKKLPPLAPNELRNPIVQQILSETFRVVNALVAEYGKPDMIRVELARELRRPKQQREEARNNAIRKRALREDHAAFLSKRFKRKIEVGSLEVKKYELWLEMGCEDPELDDLDSFMRHGRVTDALKYKLWLECGRISPYSGRVIPLSRLFSPEIQIEHILPYSKTMNDEFTNLCLCEADINKEKGDKLPFEYFAARGPAALSQFKSNVERIQNDAKKRRFLSKEIPEDFLNSQLTNTSYAARELAARLEQLLPPVQKENVLSPRVQVVNGQATATLRRLWGLNAILSQGDIDTKNRGDHRHHAIDAFVVSCTTPSLLHTLARYSKFDGLNRLRNDQVKEPWDGFVGDSSNAIESIIVSYRNQKRLVGRKPNKTRTTNLQKHPDGYQRRTAITIRGPLHQETLYGSIQEDGEQRYVTRWPLTKFTKPDQLDKIVDAKVREVLKERVRKYGSIKKAFEPNDNDPVLMYSAKGVRVPIRHVRVINPGEHLEEVRRGVFVETGNNYAIAIYEDPVSKRRTFETVSFYRAVQRSLAGEPIVKETLDDKPLLMTLKQRDTVAIYDESSEEIDWNDRDDLISRLFRVRKMDVNGNIVIDYLYAAKINDEDRNRLFYQRTYGSLKAVKIDVDVLGRIVSKQGI